MANKKDMRREDLIVPYREPDKDKEQSDALGTMSSTLPMAAIFTRNKLLGWTSVMFATQSWLSETPAQKASAATPSYFSVGMALLAVAVSYMPLFMPPQVNRGGPGAGSGTGAPGPVPLPS